MMDRERVRRSASLTGGVGSGNGITKATPKKKSVACRRCHSKKTKCSGEQPCHGCVSAGTADSCTYQARDRTVKINESYLQQLLEENERMKQSGTHSPSAATPPVNPPDPIESPTETSVINPLIEDRAWFEPYTTADLPIYVGEAACTSFTTRFRQALEVPFSHAAHSSRFHYISDERVTSDLNDEPDWPSKVKAQLYVKVALAYVGNIYHIILTSATLKRLDQIYKNMSCVSMVDTCKFFTLFAFGEVYSNKSKMADSQEVPGLSYFTAASRMMRVLPERASIDHIENLILLSFYSHILNRRHSAYHYIGMAVSLSRTLGLHHTLPPSIIIDPAIRQHRIRLWWTLYYCDRVWGSKLGHTSTIQTSTISVELPSMTGLNDEQMKDFPDPEYAIASIKLAKIVGDTIDRIYSRSDSQPFIQAVRSILRDVKDWMENLPASFRLPHPSSSNFAPRNTSAMHLSCNQCVILATRPVLLHVLKESLATSSAPNTPHAIAITPTISALAETCIHTARHSNDLLTQAWVNGTLTTFGYFDAHYLFSSAVILAISSILTPTCSDGTAFETSTQLLKTMADNGNLSAAEFSGHLEYLQRSMTLYSNRIRGANAGVDTRERDELAGVAPLTTTEMALGGTPMQDFLRQQDGSEFDLLNPLLGFDEVSFMDPGWFPEINSFQQ